jgi:hypothetical protein
MSYKEVHGAIFPLLKSNEWAEQVEPEGTIVTPFFSGTIEPHRNPFVAYCYDMGENVSFLRKKDLHDDIEMESLHLQSLDQLKVALADTTGWQQLNFDEDSEDLEVIVLSGNYYCSEAILSPDIMRRAHNKLNSNLLAVSIPARGKIFAIDGNVVEESFHRFVLASLRQYYNSDATPISSVIWKVVDGKVVGFFEGTESLEDAIEDEVFESFEDEDENIDEKTEAVQVDGVVVNEDDGDTLNLTFMADNWEVLISTVETVSQSIAERYNGEDALSGRVNIIIISTPLIKEYSNDIVNSMNELIEFLNQQMTNIGQGPSESKPFIFNYELSSEISTIE